MHEGVVAQSVLAAISAEATRQNARPVTAKISCGALNCVNNEALHFAFEAISRGTVCEGLKLDIEQKPIQAKCKKCRKIFEFDVARPACGNCGCEDMEILPDAPLLLEEIEFEE
jgi:hydrogenase nickel incorporation protein HypA/HybF